MTKRKHSPYNSEHVSIRLGISLTEAEEIVRQRKLKTSGSLDSYILRHGEEEGRKRFAEFSKKSAHTLETFQKKYGKELGEQRYKEYLKTKESRSPEYFKKKYGDNWEIEMEKFISDWKYKLTLEGYIKKYGEEIGKIEYEKMCSKKSHSLESFVQRFGKEEGPNKYKDYIKSKDSNSIEYFMAKYGQELGPKMYEDNLKNCSSIFREFCKLYDYETACKKYESVQLGLLEKPKLSETESKFYKIKKPSGPSSKSSKKFFTALSEALGRELKFGGKKEELRVFNAETGRLYFFDCFDEKTNTIIEYNGSAFHYHETFDEGWVSAFGETKETTVKRDLEKISFAKKLGYNIIIVWDFETSNIRKTERTLERIKGEIYELEQST